MTSLNSPLAERMRPTTLENYVGQIHLVSRDAPLSKAIAGGHLPSMIFWGPPGSGKTTLAQIIAKTSGRPFHNLSAVSSGVKEVREVIEQASRQGLFQQRPILFIDEIHRFSKSQQDALLGAVEQGVITLIGATTENPSFEVNAALLSRCQVYTLQPLSAESIQLLIQKALTHDSVLAPLQLQIEHMSELIRWGAGDARRTLNLLELAAAGMNVGDIITAERVKEIAGSQAIRYDKGGEMHYDIISAFIKSIRGSHPDAALYYLAAMYLGGEDPEFIARRLVILAAEDIGLANPNALLMAEATQQIVARIGWPESRIVLSECVIYLATSPKSNSAYTAIDAAIKAVQETGGVKVPLHLRNAPTRLMKELGYGEEYKYAHAYEGNFIRQTFLPDELSEHKFYDPGKNPREEQTREWLERRWGNKEK
jgi:putative ATPase